MWLGGTAEKSKHLAAGRPGFTFLLCLCLTVWLLPSTSNGKRGCHYLPCRAVVKTESKLRKERLLSLNFIKASDLSLILTQRKPNLQLYHMTKVNWNLSENVNVALFYDFMFTLSLSRIDSFPSSSIYFTLISKPLCICDIQSLDVTALACLTSLFTLLPPARS